MANANTPRPGDTQNNLFRKILTVMGGVASPGDTDEEITAKLLSALQSALSGGGGPPLGYTPENVANKDTDGTFSANSDVKYPSQKAAKTYVDGKFGYAPIGSVVAWAKTITGTPALPSGWMECNGAQINDAASPMNNQFVPNLNTGQNKFLRGHTVSGDTGGSATHAHTFAGTTSDQLSAIQGVENDAGNPITVANANHSHDFGGLTDLGSSLPPYYTVVWIIRIK